MCSSRILQLTVVIALMFPSAHVMADLKSAEELQKLLAPISSAKAEFTHKLFNENNKIIQESQGNFEVKRPNMFRWQLEKPEPNLIVTNGRKLWNYDVELEQVTVHAYKTNNEVSPISFLFNDIATLNRDFAIVLEHKNSSVCSKYADKCFKLTPRKENTNFKNIELGFKIDDLKVLCLFDHLGQTSVFEFKHLHRNPKISNKRFEFVPPSGVDVISDY